MVSFLFYFLLLSYVLDFVLFLNDLTLSSRRAPDTGIEDADIMVRGSFAFDFGFYLLAVRGGRLRSRLLKGKQMEKEYLKKKKE